LLDSLVAAVLTAITAAKELGAPLDPVSNYSSL